MTLVVYKDGVMCADGSSWAGDVMVAGNRRKIVRSLDGALSAATGRSDRCLAFQRHFASIKIGPNFDETFSAILDAGIRESDDKEFTAVVVSLEGRLFLVDERSVVTPMGRDFVASGSGEEFAYGLLIAGMPAEQVIRECVQRCPYVGGDIQVERLAQAEGHSLPDEPEDRDPGDEDSALDALGFNGDGRRFERWREEHGLS